MRLFLGTHAAIELDAGHGLTAKDFEEGEVFRVKAVGLFGEDGE